MHEWSLAVWIYGWREHATGNAGWHAPRVPGHYELRSEMQYAGRLTGTKGILHRNVPTAATRYLWHAWRDAESGIFPRAMHERQGGVCRCVWHGYSVYESLSHVSH